MTIARRVDPATIVDRRADRDNHLLLVRPMPGELFIYHSGSVRDRGAGGGVTRAARDADAAGARLDGVPPGR